MAGIVPRLQAYVCNSPIIVANPRVKALLEHPAGPFTSELCAAVHQHAALLHHCLPPQFTSTHQPSSGYVNSATQIARCQCITPTCSPVQFISLANLADLQRSPETLSLPQQIAIAATGLVWSRYSMVINPVNWNLLSVNIFMAGTGLYQLARIATHDPTSEAKEDTQAAEEDA